MNRVSRLALITLFLAAGLGLLAGCQENGTQEDADGQGDLDADAAAELDGRPDAELRDWAEDEAQDQTLDDIAPSDEGGPEQESEDGQEGDAFQDAADQLEDLDQQEAVDQTDMANEEPAAGCGNGQPDEGEECDDGNRIDGDGCDNDCTWTCQAATQEIDCDDARPCSDDLCDEETHLCRHPASPESKVCRPAARMCDAVETCDGESAECPADDLAEPGTECDDGLPCTWPDLCDLEGTCVGAATGELHDVTAASAARAHTCALLRSGGLMCWGSNTNGQLGDGTTVTRALPLEVSGLSSGVAAVEAAGLHTCARLSSGGLLCWGSNTNGQLGDGTTENRLLPVNVSGLSSAVASVAAGNQHACALLSGGAVRCWGRNDVGQLGDGTSADRHMPIDVSGLASGVIAVSMGYNHSCGLLSGGAVRCWGRNEWNQLGDGTTTDRLTPIVVSGLTSGVAAVSAGYNHTCALLSGGGVKCWGSNSNGEIGDGLPGISRPAPVDVSGLSSGVLQLSAGGGFTCVLLSAGGVKCWGSNADGQVGDGTLRARNLPAGVLGLPSGVASIATGREAPGGHVCAVMSSGGLLCWGRIGSGQLGDGVILPNMFFPVQVIPPTSGAAALSAGTTHACALLSSGEVKCWGANFYGQLGDGTTLHSRGPVGVTALSSVLSDLDGGESYTCAALSTGAVKCWGRNDSGQLGNGTSLDSLTPVDVSGLSSAVSLVSAGGPHACALLSSGEVRCWGANFYGQLGDGTTLSRATPAVVPGLSSGAAGATTGRNHSCALLTSGGVKCWGQNTYGQIGDATMSNRLTPVRLIALESGVAAVAAGHYHTCALLSTGGAQCWGSNMYGELGIGTTVNRTVPVDVLGLSSGVAVVEPGVTHTCALLSGGAVRCWGNNNSGQVGDGTTINRSSPLPVSGLDSSVVGLALGDRFSCALLSTGAVTCWGYDANGQASGMFHGYPRPVLCP